MGSISELTQIFRYHARGNAEHGRHDFSNVFQKAIADLKNAGFDGLNAERVLDLGCGQRFPNALLFASHGAKVTALDMNVVQPGPFIGRLTQTAKTNGAKRAVKSALRELLFDKGYYTELEKAAGKQLRAHSADIAFSVGDPTSARYDLPSESFDLIVSNAVLEHVADVPGFASEIKRLLKPGGVYYSIIHNYYSISGGHDLDWAQPDKSPPASGKPWAHLRDGAIQDWVYLNRLKPEEYLQAFGSELEVLHFESRNADHDPGGSEGETFLSADVEQELAKYPRELLLTRAYCLIVRKS